MGFKTDLSAKRGVLRFHDEACGAFEAIQRNAGNAIRAMPTNRDLINQIMSHGFRAA